MSMVGQSESDDIFVSELKAKFSSVQFSSYYLTYAKNTMKLRTYDNRIISFTVSNPMGK